MNFETENNSDLQKAIINVVAYFDMFDFPLTDFEVWKFLGEKCDYMEVRNILSKISQVETKNGFYFLKGRENIIRTRLDRYNFTDRKFKRALKVAKIYRLIPWVKMVAVANVIGAHNLKDGSDIDVFIISEKNKIWLTRFFCAGIAKILGLRPSENNSRDKICLNFYLSEEDMDLKKFMVGKDDIYFIYWLANLIIIYDKGETYKKFIQANNWLKNYLPNWQEAKMVNRRFIEERKDLFINFLFNFIFGHLDNLFKKIQLRMLPVEMKKIMNKDTRVVINDKVLKLHIKDRREEYRKRWEEKIKQL